MSIGSYFQKLRVSDESTKHRAALTISIIASVIILSIGFILLKDRIFNFSNNTETVEPLAEYPKDDGKERVSIWSSFTSFFKESGNQLSNIKSSLGEVYNASKNESNSEEKNKINQNINKNQDSEITISPASSNNNTNFVTPTSTTSSSSNSSN